ncbi:MAG: serine hydrolase [Gemmatimonadales bacterium]|nr:serine hydrolase [Gemmatimonadales bacterium]
MTPSSAQSGAGPTGAWRQYATPEAAGFSSEGLAKAFRYADSVRSGAVMIVYRGSVVGAWGDVSRKLDLRSVRKSLVSALFGIAADRKQISLDRTLGSLGIADNAPLTAAEQGARIRDLLAARSGVYLPAAYADASQDTERPARGSHAPNTFWFYNNWDFNTLGVIYERFVDSSLYASFDTRVAGPIGMEDYQLADGYLVYEPTNSLHPAHTFRMSARDLARFGQLYLQGGAWNGRRLIPREWVAESTAPKSTVGGPGQGYGYMWWTRAPGSMGATYPEADKRALYYGSGTGGQLVLVIPSDELVIVHRGDTDNNRYISGRDAWRIVELILSARTGTASGAAARIPLTPAPFASQLPAVPEPVFIALDAPLRAELSGRYEIAPNTIVRLFEFAGRLFGNFPGQGEAELFGTTRSSFTIRALPGVRIDFERDAAGRVTGMSGQIGPPRFRGVKQ